MRTRTLLSLVFALFIAPAAAADAPASDAKPTCALCCLDRLPLATLIEAELLKNDKADWLERNRIDAVLREQELQTLSSPEGGARRIALGRLLKARVLVLLSSGKAKKTSFLNIVVCESGRGLRLLVRTLPLTDQPAADAAAVVAAVNGAIQQVRSPIRAIYAVPPLVSKNLTYENDFLRIAYARHMEQWLLEQPETLVVELAEAESIARESKLSGETAAGRAPLFVLGEYRHAGQGKDARVQLSLALRQGEKELAKASDTVRAEEATAFLGKTLAGFVKRVGTAPPRESQAKPEEEAAELARLSREHQKLGDWQEALGLAEASLLLVPNQPDLERDAVADIIGSLDELALTVQRLKRDGVGNYEFTLRRAQLYRRGLAHLEAAIRGRPDLSPGDKQFSQDFFYHRDQEIEPGFPKEIYDLLREIEEEKHQSFLRLAEDCAKQHKTAAVELCLRLAIDHLDSGAKCAEYLKFVLAFQDSISLDQITTLPFAMNAIECRDMLTRLMSAPESTPNTRDWARARLKYADRIRTNSVTAARSRSVESAKTAIAPTRGVVKDAKFALAPVKIESVRKDGFKSPLSALRCMPAGKGIDLFWDSAGNFYVMKTKGEARPVGISLPRGPGRDVEEWDVTFDGRLAWVITRPNPVPRIMVIDPVKETWWELTAKDGLPLPGVEELPGTQASDYRVLAAPVAPGKVCIAAGFGRSWLALVSCESADQRTVRVFHEAIEVQDAKDREQWKKSSVAFRPTYMVALGDAPGPDGKGGNRRILIGRGDSGMTPNLDFRYHPLLVDPEKPAVEVLQTKEFASFGVPRSDDYQPFTVHDGAVYFPYRESPTMNQQALYRIALPDMHPQVVCEIAERGIVEFTGDRLHIVGKQWWSGAPPREPLTSLGSVPWQRSTVVTGVTGRSTFVRSTFDRINESNHYGLLVGQWSAAPKGLVQVVFGKEAAALTASQAPTQPAAASRMGAAAKQPEPAIQDLAAAHPLTDRSIAAAKTFAPRSVELSHVQDSSIAVAVSSDGRRAAQLFEKGGCLIWSLPERRPVRLLRTEKDLLSGTFSPDGRLFAAGRNVWDVDSGEPAIILPYESHSGDRLFFSPDGEFLVVERHGAVWNVRTRSLEYGTSVFSQIWGFLPDGSLIAIANDTHRTPIAWNLRTHTYRRMADHALGDLRTVSPDGTRLAFIERWWPGDGRLTNGRRLAIWDEGRQQVIRTIDDPRFMGPSRFSEDGKRLSVLMADLTVLSVDIADERLPSFKPDYEVTPAAVVNITAPRLPVPESRSWTSADEKFHAVARLVDADDKSVVLLREDGNRVTVPREKLSRADLDYVQQIATAKAAATPIEPVEPVVPSHEQNLAAASVPIVASGKGITQREFLRLNLEFNLRLTRDVYQRQGKKNRSWDAAAIAFLEETAAAATYGEANPLSGSRKIATRDELRAMGEALQKLGCNDPLVFTAYLKTQANQAFHDSDRQVAPALKILDDMQAAQYPPLQVADAAREIRRVCEMSNERRVALEKTLADSLLAALSAREFPGIDRRLVFLAAREQLSSLPITTTVNINRNPAIRTTVKAETFTEFYNRLRNDQNADRWLSCMVVGDVEFRCGLRLGQESELIRATAVQSGSLQERWRAAYRYFSEAWKLHPEYPEAAAELARLAGEGGAEGDSPRMWFDRAVAAQFDWIAAYTAMCQPWLDRGDAAALDAFGRQCLQTGRYDTLVPCQYLNCLRLIASASHSQSVWQRPDVNERLRTMFGGYASQPHEMNTTLFTVDEACCAFLGGRLDDARRALDKAGDAIPANTVRAYGLDVAALLGRTYAGTGPLKALFVAMQKADAAEDSAEAAELCREMLAKIDKSHKSWFYLRNRGTALNIEAELARGDWVNIQPDADLAGWTADRGDWSVDAQGGLIGQLDARGQDVRDARGMTLLCQARVGARYELRGHAELLDHDDDWPGYGALVGYSHPGNYWECLFYRESADIVCHIHHNTHRGQMVSKPSDDFRIVVYDDHVAMTAGELSKLDELPFVLRLGHDTPSATTPIVLSASRSSIRGMPVSVRFTNLKIRKLSSPPMKMKMPSLSDGL